MTDVLQSAEAIDSSAIDHALQLLERELERSAGARPPSDEALDRWQVQGEEHLSQLCQANLPGRNRLVRRAERFLESLRDMRERKARYLARRDAIRALVVHETTNVWVPKPEDIHQSQLANSIRSALGQMTAASVSASGPEMFSADQPPTAVDVDGEPQVSTESVEIHDHPLPSAQIKSSRAQPVAAMVVNRALDATSGTRPRLSRRTDPIVAIEGRLARGNSFEAARSVALGWLQSKGFKLPVWKQSEFEIRGRRGHTATAVGLPEHGLWALQAETTDTTLRGRRWRVEMVLLEAEPTPAVSVTLTAISPAGSPPPPVSVPRLVTHLVEEIGVRDPDDGALLDAGPATVSDLRALHSLLASLSSRRRARPILVLSTYVKDSRHKQFMDPEGLARKMVGLAQVVVLGRDMMWPFNEAVGRKAAVFGASIRLFRPGFTPEDDAGSHPLWSPAELEALGLNMSGLSDVLLREVASESLRALEREDAIPAFDRVRDMVFRRQIEIARQKAETASLHRANDNDVSSIRAELESEIQLRKLFEDDNIKLAGEVESFRTERNSLRDERDLLRGRALYLEARVQELQLQLREAQGQVEPSFPDNWDELEEWCEEYLGERVILTRKAIRAAQDSKYENIPFAYRVLWFLADRYVPARREGGEGYKNGLKDLGLEINPVGRSARERRSRDTYSTDYKRERVPLDWHVKGSSDRDPRYGFRIYFHWHEKDQCMVIGSLPEHLDNALS